MECCICLSESRYYTKCSANCKVNTCYSCINEMIKYSRDAIKCPECNSFYYFSQINVLDEHYNYLVPNIRIYMQQLINTLLTKGEKEINKYIMEKHISEKVRKDRKQYLENQTF